MELKWILVVYIKRLFGPIWGLAELLGNKGEVSCHKSVADFFSVS